MGEAYSEFTQMTQLDVLGKNDDPFSARILAPRTRVWLPSPISPDGVPLPAREREFGPFPEAAKVASLGLGTVWVCFSR